MVLVRDGTTYKVVMDLIQLWRGVLKWIYDKNKSRIQEFKDYLRVEQTDDNGSKITTKTLTMAHNIYNQVNTATSCTRIIPVIVCCIPPTVITKDIPC